MTRPDPDSLASDQISSIVSDANGALWVGTYGGLDQLVEAGVTDAPAVFKHYRHDPSAPTSLTDDRVNALYIDKQGALWIGGWEGGLSRFDPLTGSFANFRHAPEDPNSLGADRITAITEDASGNLWVGTWSDGVDVLALSAHEFVHLRNSAANSKSLSNDAVRTLFVNNSGLVWIGTQGGVNLYDSQGRKFDVLTIGTDDSSTDDSVGAHSVLQDRDGVVWVGTLTHGIFGIDRRSGARVHYSHDEHDPNSLSDNTVRAIYEDARGVLWVGTYDGLDRLDRSTQEFTHFRHRPGDPTSLSENTIYAVHEDRYGRLWVGTWDGLDVLDRDSGQFSSYKHDPARADSLNNSSIGTIYEDDTGELWIGTNSGLHRYDRAQDSFVRYIGAEMNPDAPGAETIFSIYRDPTGWLWLGTWDGVVRFNPDTQEAQRFTTADGLSSNTVWGILPDDAGNLWISTSQGLNRFNPPTSTFTSFGIADGLPTDSFTVFAYDKGLDGELFFGTLAGLISFDPRHIATDPNPPPVVFTELWVGRQPVTVNEGSFLQQTINATDGIQLTYEDQVFSVEFAALNFLSPQRSRFRYLLEGFDADWVEVDNRQRDATYTNLEPGKYVLRVTASNGNGVWNTQERTLNIAILPPWWATTWFRLLVGGLGVAAFATIYAVRVESVRRQNRSLEEAVATKTVALQHAHLQQIELRQQESEQRQIAEDRSHELATLLRVIQDLTSTLDLDHLLGLLLEDIRKIVPYSFAAIFGLQDGELIGLAASTAADSVAVPSLRLSALASGELLRVLDGSQTPVLTDLGAADAIQDRLRSLLAPYPDLVDNSGKTWIALPLQVRDHTIGVLVLVRPDTNAAEPYDRDFVLAVTGYASVAMENAQLYRHARAVATDEERSRLARELHDAVTQTLFSANLIADVLPEAWEESPEIGREGLRQLQQLMRGALAEMRTLLLELRPAALEKKPLGELLRSLCEAVSSRAQVRIDLTSTCECQYPAKVQLAFYRITQEALNNIMKYARAQSVRITLDCAADAIDLSVVDDGIGFDPASVPAGRLGLVIMRERAESIGAEISVISAPRAGARVEVHWRQAPSGRTDQ